MARIFGRRGSLTALGILGLIALAPLAVYSPILAGGALALLAVLATGLAHRRATALAARCDKLSAEVDVLSKRLLRIEGGARAATPGDASADLAAGVEEVTVEIGLLSGIVRDLAAVVATQDGEIARLKTVAEAAPAAAEPPHPTHIHPAHVHPAPRAASVAAPPAAPEPEIQAPRAPVPRPMPPRALPPRALPPVRRAPEPAPFVGGVIELPPPEDHEPLREAALIAAFDADGLEVHLQPVVTLPQRKVASYEALARLRVAGEVLAPEAFLPVLERHGRSTDLDRRMLQRVATIARHLAGRGSEAAVSYGLSPLSLFEPGFLRSLARLVASEPGLAGRLVVALPQASWRNLDAEQAGALAAMRGKIGFILDRPTDLRFDALSLAERGVAQVKVSADLLLRQAFTRQNLSDIAVEDLVAALARAGIRLVANAVERETDVPDLIDLDVPFAQGAVFAAPRAVRADVLAGPAQAPAPGAPASPPPSSPDEPEPPPQRRPFRDFLRRAS
ncbi:EAL domain-containing protein [Methylobacterium planeticum]|uniref:EAL domain-containing protein n=1 Tax=Methylobacterium planeticum TaxID=2615211 RepID=A0A6N6MUI4_9HYPH|nr:EAL domain-containing protein [Methylobacterium planeticum]KAB1075608.1 EAL domain-containing protein [Methylobacterium planeticum]